VVSAVGAAHALGIVHRDLKPENIFIEAGPPRMVKVLDFGVAKLTAAEGDAAATAGLTESGALVGTPYYMSPEQAFGERDVDHRTDVWALGLILYRCLSGVLPTRAENVGQVFKSIVARPIRPLAQAAPEVPADVAALVDKMLSRARRHRSGDLHEVTAVLERYTDVRAPEFGAVLPGESEAVDAAPAAGEASVDTMVSVDPLAATEALHASGTARRFGDSGSVASAAASAVSTPRQTGRAWPALAGVALAIGAIALYPVVRRDVQRGPAPSATAPMASSGSAPASTPVPTASTAPSEAAHEPPPVVTASAPTASAKVEPPPRRPGARVSGAPPAARTSAGAVRAKPPEVHDEEVLRRAE
jgi:serine/threonine-protein kinase